MWNKENLLKMEIESSGSFAAISDINAFETKKISWKWRLKVCDDSDKRVLSEELKQRKSPENGDWKLITSRMEQ